MDIGKLININLNLVIKHILYYIKMTKLFLISLSTYLYLFIMKVDPFKKVLELFYKSYKINIRLKYN